MKLKCRLCKKILLRDSWGRQRKIFCGKTCMSLWTRTPAGKRAWRRAQEFNIPLLKKRIGPLNPAYKPIEQRKSIIVPTGYRMVPVDNHPFVLPRKRLILEHRFVMENYLREKDPSHPALIDINGVKYLNKGWIVHHKNGDRLDNRIENLEALFYKNHHYGHVLTCPHCKKVFHP